MTRLGFFVCFLIFSSCSSMQNGERWSSQASRELPEYYFTYDMWYSSCYNEYDSAAMNDMSNRYIRFDETSLMRDTADYEAFRFTYQENHGLPVVIRVEKRGHESLLFVKREIDDWPSTIAEIEEDSPTSIGEGTWNELSTLLDSIEFWNTMPTDSCEAPYEYNSWLIEGKRDTLYHLMHGSNLKRANYPDWWKLTALIKELE
ncbi:MAG: hypothetical protein HWE14_06445 [Flavobacteriia bacterium]|nr:hypothetical protein [Flavobacteriia bacterium]